MRVEFKSQKRGYMLMLDQDLFGAYILYRQWWGLLNRRGGPSARCFSTKTSQHANFNAFRRPGYVGAMCRLNKQSTDTS